MFVWVELVCAACARSTAGRSVTGAIPRREMKSEAKREGWQFRGKDSYCSSWCEQQMQWQQIDKQYQKDLEKA